MHTGFSEEGKVVWYSHVFKNFPQFVVIHTVKAFHVVNEAEVDVFLWNSLLSLWSNECQRSNNFEMIQGYVAQWVDGKNMEINKNLDVCAFKSLNVHFITLHTLRIISYSSSAPPFSSSHHWFYVYSFWYHWDLHLLNYISFWFTKLKLPFLPFWGSCLTSQTQLPNYSLYAELGANHILDITNAVRIWFFFNFWEDINTI